MLVQDMDEKKSKILNKLAAFIVRKLMEEKEIKIDTNEQKEKLEKSKLSNPHIKTEFLTPNQNCEPLKNDTKTSILPTIYELAIKMEEKEKIINTIVEDVKAVKNDLKTILKIMENLEKTNSK
jgi:hypothetical protein